ncbi:Crp/Fnr family transcriptional regulator [Streptomyces sp. NBC_00091]|uniref:Crp/Fnr family transcriptional regulator n=1 Tax=Streptomyces sp. NBC_00091 TaxID=2975648 RepID=UPI002254C7E3|nr:Crp/Fnr family transcriptional regulator [Streptomyces sp. NBC_00091]MCX5376779.1 Crp/Fnr family transcriptional regulator [Streptomyces sp. NBC_00091]
MAGNALAELLNDGIPRLYAPRTRMLRQGEDGTHLLVLTGGVARVVLGKEDGTDLWLAHRGPGCLLGDMSVLSGAVRNASVIAVSPCTAVVLHRDRFLRRVESGALASLLYRQLLARQHEMDLAHSEQWSLPVKVRLAGLLVRLVGLSGSPRITGWTQADLARAAGASLSAITPVLRTLTTAGMVQVKRRLITVTDLPALRALAAATRA